MDMTRTERKHYTFIHRIGAGISYLILYSILWNTDNGLYEGGQPDCLFVQIEKWKL
jgi:hypothetical protein